MGARASSVAMANAITGIGHSLKKLNRVDEATKVLDGAIDLLRDSGHPFMVDTLRTKASWCSEAGNWQAALDTYLEAVRINEIDGISEFIGRDLLSMAHCYSELGEWQKVIDTSLRAREMFKGERLIAEISWCDLNLGDAYASLGDSESAITWGQRANDVAMLRRDNEVICKSNYVMARGHMVSKNYQEAENLLEGAKDLVARSGDWVQVRKIEKALIELYRATERENEALEAERRLETLKEILD